MPKLITECVDNTCYLCGCQAYFISYNSKKLRCVEKITQCPGFVKKAEETRQKNISKEKRRAHMKNMSEKGNTILKELHTNKDWLTAKGDKISKSIENRGGHIGENNPMYRKSHSSITKKKMSEKANKRDPECYLNATDTKIQRGLAIPKEQKTKWELYREQVLNYTNKNWQHCQDKINPLGLQRGKNYELDHKYSITEGFKHNVDPIIIGHYTNLELLTTEINRSKRIKCSITLAELTQLYNLSNSNS